MLQQGEQLVVRREDQAMGWDIDLAFKCCPPYSKVQGLVMHVPFSGEERVKA